MIHEDWLCSSFKLCDLVDVSESVHNNDSTQLEINKNTFPQPSYNPSSIKITFEAYSLLLDSTFEKNVKHTNKKIIEGCNAQTESIHHFAQMTAKCILDSALMRGATPSTEHGLTYHPDNNQTDTGETFIMRRNCMEMLAEELTLEAFHKALEEIGERCVFRSDTTRDNIIMEGGFVPFPSGYSCDEDTSEMETDTKMGEYDHKFGTSAYATSLKRMVTLGSIEYPDAPPSTPLLPEMFKSRDSFSRKLKGGLAKEFLPSPPPPTPKDRLQPLLENQRTDTPTDKSDFMMRLMRSLSLECGKQGRQEEQKAAEVNDGGLQNEIPSLFDYASQLSADILHFINTDDIEGIKQVCAIAEQPADGTVKTSLAEVMAREKEITTDQNGHKAIMVDAIPLSASQQKPSMALEEIQVLASELIINAVVHAFAKLKQSGLKHGNHPHLLGQATEQKPREKETYSNTHFCKDSTKSNKATTVSCCDDELEFDSITSDAVKMTSSVHIHANNFAESVLENAVRDASSLLVNVRQTLGTHVNNGSLTCVIKMHAEESHEVQELQCALLWAAASQKGASELCIDLPDTSLKQKLCRLSRSAHVNGWTVGTLIASLCLFCDVQQEATRGQYETSESLLEHLKCLIDKTPLN
ncbi:hypothetical protein E1301_Tti005236 [Triplophysa tibetana]|uniref:A-kinase anchor protein 11 n=1 Tax=Triplophysa tibetana TaxID=1572043 RepID=A0A5A9PQS7_9TELE|nr:hypothetical protein E1301_Tti005236 [Triplophysa tibetana]